MNTKQGNCPFCSTWTTLHQLVANDGSDWWACKTGSSSITCYSVWEKQLKSPLTFTMGDF